VALAFTAYALRTYVYRCVSGVVLQIQPRRSTMHAASGFTTPPLCPPRAGKINSRATGQNTYGDILGPQTLGAVYLATLGVIFDMGVHDIYEQSHGK
jgi:hypothetical protein